MRTNETSGGAPDRDSDQLAGSGGSGDWSGGGLDEATGPTEAGGPTGGTGGEAGAPVADPSEYAGEPTGSQVGVPTDVDPASGA